MAEPSRMGGQEGERLRRGVVVALLLLSALPFAFVDLPPLVDAPGHLGQFAVQAAGPDSPLSRYFTFHWALRLNLGTDLLMEPLRHLLSLQHAFLLVTALIPVLTVVAVLLMARHANPGDAAAASWALPFAYSYPFHYGFLNFTLGMALAFIAFALWCRWEASPARREIAFWLIIPILLLCHAVGGGLLPLMILARETGAADGKGAPWRGRAAVLRPLLSALPPILIWKLGASGGDFPTVYHAGDKINAIVFGLRDQVRWLDLASMAAAIAVPILGALLGARYGKREGAVVLVLAALFLAMPSELAGATFTDTRLVPALALAALTLQDWSAVSARKAAFVALAGLALFAARLVVTTTGFIGYQRGYASERQALAHIARGSRVLALVTHQCHPSHVWRMSRLDHIAALATVERDAWVNTHWSIGDIHLMRIDFRPSPDFYADPSQYVWPAACIQPETFATAEAWRNRRRPIADVMPDLPLGKVDYLWLIDARLPPGPWAGGLRPVWSNGRSTLYRTMVAERP